MEEEPLSFLDIGSFYSLQNECHICLYVVPVMKRQHLFQTLYTIFFCGELQ